MNWINIKTEYSFGAVYGPIDRIVKLLKRAGTTAAGICDMDGTWGFVPWHKECTKWGIKPIFGVSLPVVADLQEKDRRGPCNRMSFIAMNNEGLKMIYRLVEEAYNNFYYIPRISVDHVNKLPVDDVTVLSGPAPELHRPLMKRPYLLQRGPDLSLVARQCTLPDLACIDNWYPKEKDKLVYEPFADPRKLERKTTPMHIIDDFTWLQTMGTRYAMALGQRNHAAAHANAKLQKAPLVKYPGKGKNDLRKMCLDGAHKIGVDLGDPVYAERFLKESTLIHSKGFEDYFMIVAKAIEQAKKTQLVGPGRGSSGGSLVCYLLGITSFDPIKYDLIFERFIDINRTDLPDIDCDFQDTKRADVIKYLKKKYGAANVSQIGNVNKLKGRSALNRFAKAFSIADYSLDELKESLIERPDGDPRVNKCIRDTFKTTAAGKAYLKLYPNMKVAGKIDGHASHSGVHAAGVLVSNKPISDYCGLNTRDGGQVAMLDMREAEWLNLLKIDALGLRTLTVLADVCDAVGIEYRALYSLSDGDKKAYKLINKGRLSGIFQLEGSAAKNLASKIKIKSIEDIAAISAIARPGPLQSGGASHFVKRKQGLEDIEYLANHKKIQQITQETMGVVVYQEQVMKILKEVGQLPWEDVIDLRKMIGKSKGAASMANFSAPFIKGAVESGLEEFEAKEVWDQLVTFGMYGFNKSHAVAYAIVSYWCAYLKAHYPLEFAVASLNNAKSPRDALKTLRDLKENEGIDYVPFDPKISQAQWSVHKGKLYGGFLTIDGIGPVLAKQAISLRDKGKPWPPGIKKHVEACVTPFRYLYPAAQIYGKESKGCTAIRDLKKLGTYSIVGCITSKSIRDANEPSMIAKRNGLVYTGNTTYLVFTVEDDSDSIICLIGRDDFEDLEKETGIAEIGKIDTDWYRISGTYNPGYNTLFVKGIRRITR